MRVFITLIFVLMIAHLNAQILTEIMYNPPESNADSLEYLEFYNNTDQEINLLGYSLIGVSHTFSQNTIIDPGAYYVICKDSVAMSITFGVNVNEWGSGALSNTGEEVGLINENEEVVHSVKYDDTSPWSQIADGGGPSLELCDLESDPTDPNNWNLSQSHTSEIINNRRLTGSPGEQNNTVCQLRDYMSLAISEILFEQPLWNTELQYIELYNYGDEPINISEWSLSGSITLSLFPNIQLDPGAYYLVGSEPLGLFNFGIIMLGWGSANQIFGQPSFMLENPNGTVVTEIDYEDNGAWPIPDRGVAIELCDPSMDHSKGSNWALSSNILSVAGDELSGTPGTENTCNVTISSVGDLDQRLDLSIYPNPSNAFVNIVTDEKILLTEIFSLDGKKQAVYSRAAEINISSIERGTYIIRVHTAIGIASRLFVKL